MTETVQKPVTRRRLFQYLDVVLPVAGVLTVLVAVVAVGERWERVWIAVAGLIMLEAGTWKLASRILYERRFIALREEVQLFIRWVRVLNAAATALDGDNPDEARRTFESAATSMRTSVERMVAVAGKTEEDLKGP